MTPAPRTTRRHQTHCQRGHAKTDDNIYTRQNGSHMCRACMRLRNNAFYARTRVCDNEDGVMVLDDPWENLSAAIVRQSLADYKLDDDDARDFLAYCGLLDTYGNIRRH